MRMSINKEKVQRVITTSDLLDIKGKANKYYFYKAKPKEVEATEFLVYVYCLAINDFLKSKGSLEEMVYVEERSYQDPIE